MENYCGIRQAHNALLSGRSTNTNRAARYDRSTLNACYNQVIVMNVKMNGQKIKRIWFNGANGDNSVTADDIHTLTLSATYHGDRDEFWVIQEEEGAEVCRHNCRYIASIDWL